MKNARIWFEKTGSAKYISHLDLVRLFTRCIRRSHLPVWYTEGYNPHIHMVFAQPLPIGIEALHEAMDIKIEDDLYPNDKILKNLCVVMPEDIIITAVTNPVDNFSDISGAEYNIKLVFSDKTQPKDLAEFFSGDIMVNKPAKKKKGRRGQQIAEFKEIEVHCRLVSFFYDKCTANMTVILPAGSSLNINPPLIIDAASKKFENLRVLSIVRNRLLIGEKGLE